MERILLLLSRTRPAGRVADLCVVFFLTSFILFFATRIDFSIAPFEDAAILMRYAQHFGDNLGIVWNVSEKPVDGATDFLFMVLVGLMAKYGLSLEFSIRLIGVASHILTAIIIYMALRMLYRANIPAALVSALYLAVGPGLYYVAAYFGTPFFALFACITWWVALRIQMERGNSHKLSLLFAISALITGLIRPEGVILAVLMLVSIVYYRGIRRSRLPLLYFIAFFVLVGGVYFFWRWLYFGYPLPNPYYKKGGGTFHLSGLRNSISLTIRHCLPFLVAFLLAIRSPRTLRRAISAVIPVAGFAVVFSLLSEEMNFGGRFQYALLPIVLISWYPLVHGIGRDFHVQQWSEMDWHKRVMLAVVVVTLSFATIAGEYKVSRSVTYHRDGRYDVARMLGQYVEKGYTIATTEAGLLPLYSRWRAVDTWGLNDQWIAHNGRITAEYLDRYKPQVIMLHAFFSPLGPPRGTGALFEMVQTLMGYAETNNYELAAAFGESPYDTHYYYVSTAFEDSTEIIEKIRSTEYHWGENGRIALNFALLRPK